MPKHSARLYPLLSFLTQSWENSREAGRMAASLRLSMQRNFHGTFHVASAVRPVIPSAKAHLPHFRGAVIAEWLPVLGGLT
jgi:hypothetical protein